MAAEAIEDLRRKLREKFPQAHGLRAGGGEAEEAVEQAREDVAALRELLGHLSYWAAEFESELRTAAEDREFDYAIPGVMSEKGPTDWNEREVIKRRGATLDEIFAEYNRATEGLLELVLAMPEPRLLEPRGLPYSPSGDPAARWHGPAGMVPYFKCMHDRYHFEQIRKWLDAQE